MPHTQLILKCFRKNKKVELGKGKERILRWAGQHDNIWDKCMKKFNSIFAFFQDLTLL